MSLLDVPALRARFAIDEADLPILQRWLTGAGVRWGLSATHRENFSVPQGLSQNAGLRLRRCRVMPWATAMLLLGFAVR